MAGQGRIAVIGRESEVLPFRAMGASLALCTRSDEAREALKQFIREEYSLILISDDLYRDVTDMVEAYDGMPVPCITALPGTGGTAVNSRQRLNSLVRRAIGIDIEGLQE